MFVVLIAVSMLLMFGCKESAPPVPEALTFAKDVKGTLWNVDNVVIESTIVRAASDTIDSEELLPLNFYFNDEGGMEVWFDEEMYGDVRDNILIPIELEDIIPYVELNGEITLDIGGVSAVIKITNITSDSFTVEYSYAGNDPDSLIFGDFGDFDGKVTITFKKSAARFMVQDDVNVVNFEVTFDGNYSQSYLAYMNGDYKFKIVQDDSDTYLELTGPGGGTTYLSDHVAKGKVYDFTIGVEPGGYVTCNATQRADGSEVFGEYMFIDKSLLGNSVEAIEAHHLSGYEFK